MGAHVTQHVGENGKKWEVAPCTLVDSDVRFAIQGLLKDTDHKPKEKASNVISVDDDDEEQDDNGVRRSKEVAEFNTNTSVGPRADHLVIQAVHKGLPENELTTIIKRKRGRSGENLNNENNKTGSEALNCEGYKEKDGEVHKGTEEYIILELVSTRNFSTFQEAIWAAQEMLVPIWKALCAATDGKESFDQFRKIDSLLVYAKRRIYTIFE
ncbi:hypothetical protein Tco_1058991, partial [Tanacetum coccineum]